MQELLRLMDSARFATAKNIWTLPKREALAVAFLRNRPDWIHGMGFTLGEAIECIGGDSLMKISRASEWLKLDQGELERRCA